jgi:dual specificity phosphatase 12
MGKSRSATVIMAFLMQKYKITSEEALAHLRQARSICEPNDGFMDQLQLYYRMHMPENVADVPEYQRWLYQREVERSRSAGIAPGSDKIRFEDEHVTIGPGVDFELKCRKCRRVHETCNWKTSPNTLYRRSLASSQFVLNHSEKNHRFAKPSQTLSDSCAHFFVDPLSWMRPELEQGHLDGRLECPKCRANVGKYAWQGMQCSCGEWICPGISIAKSRVDKVAIRSQDTRPSQPAASVRPPVSSRPSQHV